MIERVRAVLVTPGGCLMGIRRDPLGRATHWVLPGGQAQLGSARLGVVPDERVKHLAHRFWIAAHDRGRGLDVTDRIKVLPGEGESGVAGELPEEGTLRTPVAPRNGCRALTSPR